jgi:hypothetical protein
MMLENYPYEQEVKEYCARYAKDKNIIRQQEEKSCDKISEVECTSSDVAMANLT